MDTASETTTTSRLSPAPAAARAATWDVDTSHANAGFKVRHLMVSHVRGHLGPVTGTVFIDEQDLARSRVDVTIDARGIDSREPKRDEHLRSADFLDVATHPTLEFRSTGLTHKRGEKFVLTGDLTIRGVTRPVELDLEFDGVARSPFGKDVIAFTASTEFDREDFGITWNVALETGGVLVSKKVAVQISVQAVREV